MLRKLLVTTLVLSGLVACGGGGDPTGPESVATVSVAAPTKTFASLGETQTLTATGKSSKGKNVGGLSFTWISANPGVATVSEGTVTAVGNGTTTITASVGSASGSTQVTVQQVASSVVVTFASDTIRAYGDTVRATASGRDAGGSAISGSVAATWTSSNPGVATVDGTGLMTAVAEGSTVIRANSGALQGERTVQVRQRAARLAVTRQPVGARAGVVFDTPPQVEIQDARGNRVTTDNTTIVTASVGTGGGTVVAGGQATASSGVVTFSNLSIGGTVGTKVLLFSGTAVGNATTGAFTLLAGLPAAIAVVGGNNQTGLAGVALPQALQASVRDGFGNGIAAVPVTFAVQQGGGSLGAEVVASDANGTAATTYTLSRFAGPSTVRATTTAAPQAQALFTATATPNGVIRGTVTLGASGIPAITVPAAMRAASASRAPHRQLRTVPNILLPLAQNRSKQAAAAAAVAANPTPGIMPVNDPTAAVPGELLVTYRAERIGAPVIGASAFRQASVVSAVSASIREAIAPVVDDGVVTVASVSPVLLTARVKIAAGTDEATAMARLRADPRVESVERNGYLYSHVVRPTAMESMLAHSGLQESVAKVPLLEVSRPFPDPRTNATFPFVGTFPNNTLYMRQAWHYNLVSLPQAWALTQGSTNVLVAVVDDGIRFDHPAMAGILTSDGYDFVSTGTFPLCAGGTLSTNGDGDGYDGNPTQPAHHDRGPGGNCANPVLNSGNHGLHVSGTIGAVRTNTTGVAGINWNTRIRPVRSLGTHGSGSFYDIAQGVLYAAGLPADNGVGGTVTAQGGPARVINMSLGGSGTSTVLENAVAQAFASGSLIIASAGNNNSSVPQIPASYPNVLSVAAVAPTLSRASYSSFGTTVDIAAPGGQTSAGSSHGVLSSTWNYQTSQPTIDSWQGTSMAAPHVTGIAALILAREPQLTPGQLSDRLLNFAIDLGAAGRDDIFGRGLVNARNVLTSSFAPPRQFFVRLVNAANGSIVRTVAANGSGAFEFGGLPDGAYWVFAGGDDSGDGLIGLPWRPWGALGGGSGPTAVLVDGAGNYPANFSITTPVEIEPNNTADVADELVIDGFVNGELPATNDADFYRLRIPTAGTYVIAATGQVGACGYALEADPVITVISPTGTQLGENDDLDFANGDLCSGIVLQLSPGDHFVRVGGFKTGRYVVIARRQ